MSKRPERIYYLTEDEFKLLIAPKRQLLHTLLTVFCVLLAWYIVQVLVNAGVFTPPPQ